MKIIIKDYKDKLIDQEPLFLERLNKKINGFYSYVCPKCGNGTGQSKTGLARNTRSRAALPHWKCFKCDLNADIIELYKVKYNISDFQEAVKGVYDYLNIVYDERTSKPAMSSQKPIENQEQPQKSDYRAFYKQCQNDLRKSSEAIKYLQSRGISLETALKYGIGYCANWISPTAKKNNPFLSYTSPRIIIPLTASRYETRDIRPDTALTDSQKDYRKQNEGGKGIFNIRALQSFEQPIFITEGGFDALSVIEAGGSAIATNGATNISILLEHIATLSQKPQFIVCLDNDKAGRTGVEKLIAGFNEQGISYTTADICGSFNDPNDHLQNDRAGFINAVQLILEPDSSTAYIETSFLEDIKTSKHIGSIKTGFDNLDKALHGGLYPGLYTIAAISSLGKTTFVHQLGDQVAKNGRDVLYFSLEQSKLELISKSIAREEARLDRANAADSLSIRRGYISKLTERAIDKYTNDVKCRMRIISGMFAIGIDEIISYTEAFIHRHPDSFPLILIDYLQIIQPSRDIKTTDRRDYTDDTVSKLKQLSARHNLTVLVISSVNRKNYLSPITFESLKESGGIEYSCDVVFGLQLSVLNDELFLSEKETEKKRKRIKEAKEQEVRNIELICLKNRFGALELKPKCIFDYTPKHDLFEETEPKASFSLDEFV